MVSFSPNTFRLQNLRVRWSELLPKSMLGRLALYVLVLRLGTSALQKLITVVRGPEVAIPLGSWGTALTVVLVIFVSVLLFRWVGRRLMWRLRNRLIVTYIFIGVIPVALIMTMAAIAGYLFANQYATSQAAQEIEAEIRNLEVANSTIAADLSDDLSRSPRAVNIPDVGLLQERFPGLTVTGWQNGRLVADSEGRQGHSKAAVLPKWANKEFHGIVIDHSKLFLCSISVVKRRNGDVLTLVKTPLTQAVLERSTAKLGMISMVIADKTTVTGDGKSATREFDFRSAPQVTGGALPEHSKWVWDPVLTYGTIAPYIDWEDGKEAFVFLRVDTRPSVLIHRLFSNTGQLADVYLGALIGLGIFLGLIELVAIFFGVGLTRTITSSVSNLYKATQHINRGDLKHRIAVENTDQLAALQSSFNSMTESLEKLLAEQKEKERLENELAIAQEVQATLFPRQLAELQSLEFHGVCLPARTVSGDYYDFLPCGEEHLGIAVGDISGKGISAALLMATVHSAVRAYEFGRMPSRDEFVRAGAAASAGAAHVSGYQHELMVSGGMQSPAEVLELLNRHLYHSTQPEKYATLFLGVWDGNKRTMTYSNGGHLPPIIIGGHGSVRRLETGGTVIGLFDEMVYEETSIELHPNDIFVAFSDGVTEPENEFGEFGEDRLIELIRENRHLPLARISELVTSAVQDWIGSAEQPDDITVVLARAR